MAADSNKQTSLHCLYYWAKQTPDKVYLTQPFPDGTTEDITWKQAADQVSRMSAHLATLGLPERSNVAILGKNSAHWILSDLAIWAAGHVSVPLYPTLNGETAAYVLEHSEAKLLFLGKLDARRTAGTISRATFPETCRLFLCRCRPGTTRRNGWTLSPSSSRPNPACRTLMTWPPWFIRLEAPVARKALCTVFAP